MVAAPGHRRPVVLWVLASFAVWSDIRAAGSDQASAAQLVGAVRRGGRARRRRLHVRPTNPPATDDRPRPAAASRSSAWRSSRPSATRSSPGPGSAWRAGSRSCWWPGLVVTRWSRSAGWGRRHVAAVAGAAVVARALGGFVTVATTTPRPPGGFAQNTVLLILALAWSRRRSAAHARPRRDGRPTLSMAPRHPRPSASRVRRGRRSRSSTGADAPSLHTFRGGVEAVMLAAGRCMGALPHDCCTRPVGLRDDAAGRARSRAPRDSPCGTATSTTTHASTSSPRPTRPYPWINYLGSEQFFSLVSHQAGGYSFYRDAKMRRLTRYRYNNIPADAGGRYLYVNDGGDVWTPSWLPVKADLDHFEARARPGLHADHGRARRAVRRDAALRPARRDRRDPAGHGHQHVRRRRRPSRSSRSSSSASGTRRTTRPTTSATCRSARSRSSRTGRTARRSSTPPSTASAATTTPCSA